MQTQSQLLYVKTAFPFSEPLHSVGGNRWIMSFFINSGICEALSHLFKPKILVLWLCFEADSIGDSEGVKQTAIIYVARGQATVRTARQRLDKGRTVAANEIMSEENQPVDRWGIANLLLTSTIFALNQRKLLAFLCSHNTYKSN